MQVPYERTGRTRQKARTRAALVAAARELLAEGVAPTVEQAAERAGVSRTSAYRYFPNQRALVVAGYPELDRPSLLEPDPPTDPVHRLELVLDSFIDQVLEHEPELRAMLRLSLELPPPERDALPLRQGRGVAWIEDAIGDALPTRERRRLALAIRAAVGIEPLVWLTDIAGLSREDAGELMRSSARTLLQAAVAQ
jgi:AcrR family transcriptional regulator